MGENKCLSPEELFFHTWICTVIIKKRVALMPSALDAFLLPSHHSCRNLCQAEDRRSGNEHVLSANGPNDRKELPGRRAKHVRHVSREG